MDYQRKRKLTFFTIGFIFLLSGVEYAVILPTIWRYLQTLDAAPYFLGLGLSAFSLSGLLSGPLFGHWSDRTRTTKNIILLANCFEIVGNFMYFMGYSKWLLLSSRFVAGVGTGAGSSIFGFLTRSTAPVDRSTVFAAVMACRQVGLLIGPAFNIFLRLCDFQLGPFVVNKYTAPGIFMCALWLLMQLVVLLMYWDIDSQVIVTTTSTGPEEEEEVEGEEDRPLVRPHEPLGCYGTLPNPCSTVTPEANGDLGSTRPLLDQVHSSPIKHSSASREFLKVEVVVLLAAQFITLFNQTALETMVTPLTQRFFNFGELENSIMYCLCGVEVIAGFVFVRWFSRRVEERVVLAVGLILCNISCVWCLIFLANPQGFSQGIRRSVGGLATILGPLWAGGLTSNLYLMLGVMMGLLVLLTIMMAVSYERLVDRPMVEHADNSEH